MDTRGCQEGIAASPDALCGQVDVGCRLESLGPKDAQANLTRQRPSRAEAARAGRGGRPILSGADLPDSGEIYIDGKEVHFRGPSDALEQGISSVYQELSLVSQLSVVQNLFLGHETGEGSWLNQKSR